MASRRPPSQRDARFSLHRLPGAVRQVFAGAGRAANSAPVRPPIFNRAFSAGGITVQDENGTVATAVTQIDFQGTAVVAASGTGEVTVTVTATEAVNTVASSGSTETLPAASTATVHYVTLTANCTFTFPTAAAGASFTLVLVQDGTGSRAATWPASVKWAGGTAPTLTTTASKRDVLSFLCADGSTWLGFTAGQNYS